jgi:hypothetical protein
MLLATQIAYFGTLVRTLRNKMLPPSSERDTLKNGIVDSSETCVTTYESTRRHIPQGRNLRVRNLLTRCPCENHFRFLY